MVSPSTELALEERLLGVILKQRWSPDRTATAIASLAAQCSLDAWFGVVRYHGLAGVLLRHHKDVLPSEFLGAVQKLAATEAVIALRHVQVLHDIHKALDAAGLRWVALKGVGLSQLLYRDLAVRGTGDVDILVSRQDVFAVAKQLAQIGFAPGDRTLDSPRTFEQATHALHHAKLLSPTGVLVELHWRTEPSPSLALPDLSVLGVPVHIQVGPMALPLLPHPLHLGYLGTHAARSACLKWKWGYDVLEMLARARTGRSPFDAVGDRGSFNPHAVAITVSLMGEALGIRVPRTRISRLGRRVRKDAFESRNWNDVRRRSAPAEILRRLQAHAFQVMLQPTLRSRLAQGWRLFSLRRLPRLHEVPSRGDGWVQRFPILAPIGRLVRVLALPRVHLSGAGRSDLRSDD